jgi:uncharacterized protein YbaR (Trm112 family)
MIYQIVCPHCNNPMQLDSAWAGQQIICPSCQQPLTAPPAPGVQQQFAAPMPPQTVQTDNSFYQSNDNDSPLGAIRLLLNLAGYGLLIFAVIDFCGMFFDYDLTGVRWSPLVCSVIGSALIGIGNRSE